MSFAFFRCNKYKAIILLEQICSNNSNKNSGALYLPMAKYRRNTLFIVSFGKNLQRIRKQKKISQEELTYRTDVPLSQIGRIERGTLNTGISIVYDISKALNISAKELFDFDLRKK